MFSTLYKSVLSSQFTVLSDHLPSTDPERLTKGRLPFISSCVLLLLLLMGCKKDKELPDAGYGYVPDKVGTYVIYEVDSTVQDDNNNLYDSTYRFQLKEIVQSIFNDNSGRPSMRIERYKKWYNDTIPYSQMNWTLTDVWYATRTAAQLEKVEENVKYLRMVFPVTEGKSWNGNAYNLTYESWPYVYTSVNVPEVINSFSFDSVATIEQINYSDFIMEKYSIEKYAKNIGLVYKKFRIMKKEQENLGDIPPYNDTTGLQAPYPDRAVFYEAKVIGYGN
jgi:hypothetical protein